MTQRLDSLSTHTPSTDTLRAALQSVIDPEVGVNIVDLGLIYDIRVEPAGLAVVMTMTSPACPMGPYLQEEVEACVRELVGYDLPVDVEVVWEPAWTPEKMSDQARLQLGVL